MRCVHLTNDKWGISMSEPTHNELNPELNEQEEVIDSVTDTSASEISFEQLQQQLQQAEAKISENIDLAMRARRS